MTFGELLQEIEHTIYGQTADEASETLEMLSLALKRDTGPIGMALRRAGLRG